MLSAGHKFFFAELALTLVGRGCKMEDIGILVLGTTGSVTAGCCQVIRAKVLYPFYMVLLIVDIITDTVEVVQFSLDKIDTTTLSTNLIYNWYACVASSWIIFLFEVYITYYSFRQSDPAGKNVL